MSIILYSTECPKCNVLKKKLLQARLPFTVDTNIQYLIEQGYKQAPMLEVDGHLLTFKEACDWVREQVNAS